MLSVPVELVLLPSLLSNLVGFSFAEYFMELPQLILPHDWHAHGCIVVQLNHTNLFNTGGKNLDYKKLRLQFLCFILMKCKTFIQYYADMLMLITMNNPSIKSSYLLPM